MTEASYLSVSEITDRIKSVLESHFVSVQVEGEIGHINAHRSGHVYCSLKDENARLDAVVWRSTVARMSYRPKPGELVLATGRLSIYGPHGTYKLVINSLQPAGLGRLQAEYDKIVSKLAAEGMFASQHKKSLPLLPRGVGVVTSATGAARRDIESVLHRRCPQIPIYLYPANVQGPSAVSDIISGIRMLDQHPHVDVIIAGRGGGSLEDLWSFNDERLARVIFACKTPIISAVGHETDTTIADMVADVRAPTPSAAAELAVPQRDDLIFTLMDLAERFQRTMETKLGYFRQGLLGQVALLRRGLDVDTKRLILHESTAALDRQIQVRLKCSNSVLKMSANALTRLHPERRLFHQRKALAASVAQIRSEFQRIYQERRLTFGRSVERLDALSPLGVLARGYSLTTRDGEIVTSHSDVDQGDLVQIRLGDGSLDAEIRQTHANRIKKER